MIVRNHFDEEIQTGNPDSFSPYPLANSLNDNYDSNNLSLLIPYGFNPKLHTRQTQYVLVLGSGGLIGTTTKESLTMRGYNVLEVLSRHHLDLRIPNALDIFRDVNISFVFFLAYEVGGAKFIQLPEHQDSILNSNVLITNNVFQWLENRKIRFTFASSSLSADNSTYGYVKRLGENRTLAMPTLGRIFRLWNAYGFEYPGPKSHAVPDFAFQCLDRGQINVLTKGDELRIFAHVGDLADHLIAIMEHFDETPLEVDLSTSDWISLADVARNVTSRIPNCKLLFSDKPAKVQKRHHPNTTTDWHANYWRPHWPFERGLNQLVHQMSNFLNDQTPSLTIIFVLDHSREPLAEAIRKIDEFKAKLYPMRIEIIAVANSAPSPIPCAFIVGPEALDQAIRMAHSDVILLLDSMTVPTLSQLQFFQHRLARDLIVYYANLHVVSGYSEIQEETVPHFANSTFVRQMDDAPYFDFSFVAATKRTWLSVKTPHRGEYLPHWFARLQTGYIAIKFEMNAWRVGAKAKDKKRSQQAPMKVDTRVDFREGIRPLIL